MAAKKEETSKVPGILEDGLELELKPADCRKYMVRGFELLVEMAESSQDPLMKIRALGGIQSYYHDIALKEFSDETVNKMARTQDKTLDEVRRLRKKPWDKDDDDNGEE